MLAFLFHGFLFGDTLMDTPTFRSRFWAWAARERWLILCSVGFGFVSPYWLGGLLAAIAMLIALTEKPGPPDVSSWGS
jgi:hypothetical protein